MKSYSQSGQDLFVSKLLNDKKNGTFLDIGCGKPQTINNTCYLETKLNWKGLSLGANAIRFDELDTCTDDNCMMNYIQVYKCILNYMIEHSISVIGNNNSNRIENFSSVAHITSDSGVHIAGWIVESRQTLSDLIDLHTVLGEQVHIYAVQEIAKLMMENLIIQFQFLKVYRIMIIDLKNFIYFTSMNWSFIICTDGLTNVHLHNSIVKSIIKQGIPNFEIIFATENMKFIPIQHPNIVTVFCNTIKDAHITFKKNLASKFAKYENLCILHDYIILANNWYQSMNNFTETWNVCSTRILKNDGSRLNDWIVYNHPMYGHSLVDYNLQASEYHYVPGLAFCVKRQFILENPLDEELTWGQGEDLEWSNRIKSKWNYKINIETFLQSLKQK